MIALNTSSQKCLRWQLSWIHGKEWKKHSLPFNCIIFNSIIFWLISTFNCRSYAQTIEKYLQAHQVKSIFKREFLCLVSCQSCNRALSLGGLSFRSSWEKWLTWQCSLSPYMLTGSLEGHFNRSHHQLIDNVLLHAKKMPLVLFLSEIHTSMLVLLILDNFSI